MSGFTMHRYERTVTVCKVLFGHKFSPKLYMRVDVCIHACMHAFMCMNIIVCEGGVSGSVDIKEGHVLLKTQHILFTVI